MIVGNNILNIHELNEQSGQLLFDDEKADDGKFFFCRMLTHALHTLHTCHALLI